MSPQFSKSTGRSRIAPIQGGPPWRALIVTIASFAIVSCAPTGMEDPLVRETYSYPDVVPTVQPRVETPPVQSRRDAADDAAIWVDFAVPAESLVLGTDKKAGVAVYSLRGELRQFLPLGRPNNIDLRQQVAVGSWQGDLAVVSNRANDTVGLLEVTADGVSHIGDFPAHQHEPYGICMGTMDGSVLVFVTYKDGAIAIHRVDAIQDGHVEQTLLGVIKLSSQLEGCVHSGSDLFVGEEDRGIWRIGLTLSGDKLSHSAPLLIDEVDGETGIAADVEGLAVYGTPATRLVASSQGNDSYAVYDLADNTFVGRFRVAANGGIDGTQDTDGVAISSASLGPDFPEGIMVVQDGFNAPAGSHQNFKFIDWRDVRAVLSR